MGIFLIFILCVVELIGAQAVIQAAAKKKQLRKNQLFSLHFRLMQQRFINEVQLKRLGAKGVVRLNQSDLQVVVGTDVEFLANEMRKNH
ncbi:PTS system N-acetyl glucosamine specific transporter subunits IIABC [Anoxybacillus thermarum]|uniref:PTS system N-acetyl glucosamine specific transporter subunits IIABC n=1 Tax=Anoxybacillus thermarum TaxID=404937 RepID=A0A0D0RXD1_9BACL|nr:hypothetical protein [Anoxybacillus thermarum]KIQ93935.1 PTS system N-acetyl glucosamine specific transporter subunits IIABC [Anoxybacillus thermarum]